MTNDKTLAELAAAYAKRKHSRPGAKAEMAQPPQDYLKLIGEFNALDKEIGRLIDRAKEMSAKSDRIVSLFPKNERDPDAGAIAESRQAMAELRKEMNALLSRFKFSRPGAKAEFAQPPFSASDLNALKRLVKQYEQQAKASKGKQGPNGENLEFKALSIAGWMQEMINYAQAGQTHRAYSIIRTSNPDYVRFLPASLVKAAWDVTKMSRPGAKAQFATTHEELIAELRALTQGKHTGEWHTVANTWLSRKRATGNKEIATEANRAYDVVEREMLARSKSSRPGAKATHAALPAQTIEAERKPGGGSHSEAVSRKIATLINEGKPQDQAVAIALDLERRGEL